MHRASSQLFLLSMMQCNSLFLRCTKLTGRGWIGNFCVPSALWFWKLDLRKGIFSTNEYFIVVFDQGVAVCVSTGLILKQISFNSTPKGSFSVNCLTKAIALLAHTSEINRIYSWVQHIGCAWPLYKLFTLFTHCIGTQYCLSLSRT